jgi:hypothetical protein
MNTFTASELKIYYGKVADGGEAEYKVHIKGSWIKAAGGPNLHSLTKEWRIKPTNKVIDLSVLIDSEVLCVFFDPSTPSSATGKLKDIRGYEYVSNNIDSSGRPVISRACKPLMNHKHAWQGCECPLPEGFKVNWWFPNKEGGLEFVDNDDSCGKSPFIIPWDIVVMFEVVGIVDGYVMPWEAP